MARSRYLLLVMLLALGTLAVMPGLGVIGLLAANALNPMAAAFKVEFTVENHLDEEIHVLPVGVVDREGTRAVLPVLHSSPLYLPRLWNREFRIPAGGSQEVSYDYDDIQISELVVRRASGAMMYVVDPDPIKGQFYPPASRSFGIDTVSLVPVSLGVAAVHKREPLLSANYLIACALLAPAIAVGWWRVGVVRAAT